MDRYVLANWKSHKTLPEALQWFDVFMQRYTADPRVQVIIAPSFVHLVPLWQKLKESEADHVALAAQDLSPFPLGAYTGEVAAAMVSGMVDYAIVGHSERRRYFHETNQQIANKVSEAAAAGIRPIVCVDQPYAEAQLGALDEADTDALIIGYGPVEAIGIDIAQPHETASRAVKAIGAVMPDKLILYGGSVTAGNAAGYMQIAGVAGLMVGTESLEAEKFAEICRIVSQS